MLSCVFRSTFAGRLDCESHELDILCRHSTSLGLLATEPNTVDSTVAQATSWADAAPGGRPRRSACAWVWLPSPRFGAGTEVEELKHPSLPVSFQAPFATPDRKSVV